MIPKLIIGLNTLQKEEWTALRRFILMYTKEDSIPFICFTTLHKQREKLAAFDTAKWHKKNMPELSEKVFLNTFSKLFLWLEEWIVFNNLKKDKVRSGIELVKHWNRCGEYKLADSNAKQVQSILDKNLELSPESNYEQYRLYYYQFYSDNPIKNRDPKLIEKMIDQFLESIRQQKLMLKTQITFWNNIKPLDPSTYQQIQQNIKEGKVHSFYNHIYTMVTERSLESFNYCLGIVLKGKIKEDDDLITIATMYLLNTALQLWNDGKKIDKDQIVDIYEFALDQNILMNSGKIPVPRFITIVNSVGVFKSIRWTDQFIDRWGNHVQTDDIEGTILFARAFNYFNHGKYTDSINLILQINIKFINSRGNIHRLSIMLYYETRKVNYDFLIDAIDRYKLFLLRRKVEMGRNAYTRGNNFIKNINLLIKYKEDKELIMLLPTNNNKWITEKTIELK